MRTPIIAGNWKLNKTIAESVAFVATLKPLLQDLNAGANGVEVVLCPVFTALDATRNAIGDAPISLAGQDMYWKESGAYTGEVSATLLQDAGAKYVVLGHSERRGRFGVPEPDLEGQAGSVFGDSDQSVNKKLLAALAAGLTAIVCVGETLQERQNGHTDAVVENQIVMALHGIPAEDVAKTVFAYEPVWAIGTGETCDALEANRVCGVIRATLSSNFDATTGDAARIQYGGSVKPENAAQLLALEHIDGALVGGASLKADSFAAIVRAATS